MQRPVPWLRLCGALLVALAGCPATDDDKENKNGNGNGNGGVSEHTGDTSLAGVDYLGLATVDLKAGSYVGTEELAITALSTGELLCSFTWDALDWDSVPDAKGADPIALPCTDGSDTGDLCAFGFTVTMSEGRLTGGEACEVFGLDATWQDGTWRGFGYSEDYQYGGYSYGPRFMYYFEAYYSFPAAWYPLDLEMVSFDGSTFEYVWNDGTTFY